MSHKKKFTDYLIPFKPDGYTANADIKVFVPQRYEIHDFYVEGEFVSVLGAFQIEVAGEEELFNFFCPAIFAMQPSGIVPWKSNRDEIDYYVLSFKKGDVFFRSTTIIQQEFIIGKGFKEFITNGHMPPWLTYDQLAIVFDQIQILAGRTIPIPHACMEMIIAHCARDPKHLNIKYRHSSMREKPFVLALRDVTNVRDSTTSRLIGSYFMDGVNSSIVNQSECRSEVEDLLRM